MHEYNILYSDTARDEIKPPFTKILKYHTHRQNNNHENNTSNNNQHQRLYQNLQKKRNDKATQTIERNKRLLLFATWRPGRDLGRVSWLVGGGGGGERGEGRLLEHFCHGPFFSYFLLSWSFCFVIRLIKLLFGCLDHDGGLFISFRYYLVCFRLCFFFFFFVWLGHVFAFVIFG